MLKKLYLYMLFKLQKIKIKYEWKKKNSHNDTSIGKINNSELADLIKNNKIYVGKNTYGKLNIDCSNASNELLRIGNYCSISSQSHFLLGGEHDYSILMDYPIIEKIYNYKRERKSKGAIIIEDDVWIGDHAIILSGVHIGKGAIVGAGAVISKDIPPYAIVVGNPGRIIKYRFSDDIIHKLNSINFENIDFNKCSYDIFNQKITTNNIDNIINRLKIK